MTNTTTTTTTPTTTIMNALRELTNAEIAAAKVCVNGEEVTLKAGASPAERDAFTARLSAAPMAECDSPVNRDTYTVTGTVWFADFSWAVCDYQEHEGWHGFLQGDWVLYDP